MRLKTSIITPLLKQLSQSGCSAPSFSLEICYHAFCVIPLIKTLPQVVTHKSANSTSGCYPRGRLQLQCEQIICLMQNCRSPTALMASGVDENYMPSKQSLIIAACLCAEGPRANTVVIPTAAEAEKDSG